MTTEQMTEQIAEYFKTQPVLKAWLFGSFARHAGITYYSARQQLDRWCQGDNPRLLRSKHGQEIIYTET